MAYSETLYNMLDENEEILWSGKPNLKCLFLESIFNPLLPFALVWALFDAFFIFALFHEKNISLMAIPLIGFFALHLMPVWIYLGGIIFSFLKHKHTAFLITNKGVYTSGGIFSVTYQHKSFDEITQATIQRGLIDKLIGVGDVLFPSLHDSYIPQNKNRFQGLIIYDIADFQEVYCLVKEHLKQ